MCRNEHCSNNSSAGQGRHIIHMENPTSDWKSKPKKPTPVAGRDPLLHYINQLFDVWFYDFPLQRAPTSFVITFADARTRKDILRYRLCIKDQFRQMQEEIRFRDMADAKPSRREPSRPFPITVDMP